MAFSQHGGALTQIIPILTPTFFKSVVEILNAIVNSLEDAARLVYDKVLGVHFKAKHYSQRYRP